MSEFENNNDDKIPYTLVLILTGVLFFLFYLIIDSNSKNTSVNDPLIIDRNISLNCINHDTDNDDLVKISINNLTLKTDKGEIATSEVSSPNKFYTGHNAVYYELDSRNNSYDITLYYDGYFRVYNCYLK